MSCCKVLMVLIAGLLHSSRTELQLPLDAVTLGNLSVVQGMISVEIVIGDIYFTNDLEANLAYVEVDPEDDLSNVTIIHLNNQISNYTIPGLVQDSKYIFNLQSNGTVISINYTLVTTGLQSVTSTLRNEIVCEFLPGSVADGCLLEWRPMSQDGETGCTVASRQDNRAIVELPSLLPGTTYEVEGYGRQGNTTLHIFPITLDGGLDIPGPIDLSGTTVLLSPMMILIITLSAVLASILIGIVSLICVIVVILKCPKKFHAKMSEDGDQRLSEVDNDESIQTSANVCYEGVLKPSQSPKQHQADNNSLHLYDDVVALRQSTESDYENVDPATGLPSVPKPVLSYGERSLDSNSERACLPLKAATPSVMSSSKCEHQMNTRSLGRTCTSYKNRHLKVPKVQNKFGKRGAVSVILEAADYEMPSQFTAVTAV